MGPRRLLALVGTEQAVSDCSSVHLTLLVAFRREASVPRTHLDHYYISELRRHLEKHASAVSWRSGMACKAARSSIGTFLVQHRSVLTATEFPAGLTGQGLSAVQLHSSHDCGVSGVSASWSCLL